MANEPPCIELYCVVTLAEAWEFVCSGMEKTNVDEHEPRPVPQVKVDRFGFVKQELIFPDGIIKSRSAFEYERYEFSMQNHF